MKKLLLLLTSGLWLLASAPSAPAQTNGLKNAAISGNSTLAGNVSSNATITNHGTLAQNGTFTTTDNSTTDLSHGTTTISLATIGAAGLFSTANTWTAAQQFNSDITFGDSLLNADLIRLQTGGDVSLFGGSSTTIGSGGSVTTIYGSELDVYPSNVQMLGGYLWSVDTGGTGASNAPQARTNLGLAIGTNVQAFSTNLTAWSARSVPAGVILGGNDTQTITNKTLSGGNNTFSNLPESAVTGLLADLAGKGTGNGTITSLNFIGGPGVSVSGNISGTGGNETIGLANTTVTAGVYGTTTQSAQLTVDAQGRIIAASNQTIAGGGGSGNVTGSGSSSAYSLPMYGSTTGLALTPSTITSSDGVAYAWPGNVTFPAMLGIVGTTTSSSALPGVVGEELEAVLIIASGVSLSSTVTSNVKTLTLSAGDWDVSGTVVFSVPTTTVITIALGGVSPSSATNTATYSGSLPSFTNSTGGTLQFPVAVPVMRVTLTASSPVYLTAVSTFSTSTLKAWGLIRARRIR